VKPNLQPTIYNNYEAKISAFDLRFYQLHISYRTKSLIEWELAGWFRVINTNENLPEIKIHISVGCLILTCCFYKGLAETMKMNVNLDTMNFLYVYAGYQYHDIPNIQMDSGCLILCHSATSGKLSLWLTNYIILKELLYSSL
jgi:hypothetical protein